MPPEPAKAKERLNKANDARTRRLKELSAQQKDAHPVWSTSEACQMAAAEKAFAEKAALEKAAADKADAEKAAAAKAAAQKVDAEKAAAQKAATEKALAEGFAEKGVPRPSNPPVGGANYKASELQRGLKSVDGRNGLAHTDPCTALKTRNPHPELSIKRIEYPT